MSYILRGFLATLPLTAITSISSEYSLKNLGSQRGKELDNGQGDSCPTMCWKRND